LTFYKFGYTKTIASQCVESTATNIEQEMYGSITLSTTKRLNYFMRGCSKTKT